MEPYDLNCWNYLCSLSDYGGPCWCARAGRVLAGRGHEVKDRYGVPVVPYRSIATKEG